MSESAPDGRLTELTEELRAAAVRLSGDDLTPDEAAALVERTARLAGEAAAELDRRARAAGAR